MKYYFTQTGLVPITCTVEELFNSLCPNLSDNKYKALMLRVLDSLLNDDTTVFRDSLVTTEAGIKEKLATYKRNILQATFDFDTYNHEEKRTSSRIINRIDYQRGYSGYTAEVYMVSTAFLNTLVRQFFIDDILESF